MAEPRSLEQRTADAIAILEASHADAWVASASASGGAHLVPLSFAWTGDRLLLATEPPAMTTRNIIESGRARIGLGGTRDVVMVDAVLDRAVPLAEADPEPANTYAGQADWDPRHAGGDFVYLVLRPERIQVWRESNEIKGRTVMRNGLWLTRPTS
jgi:hypothetical protein